MKEEQESFKEAINNLKGCENYKLRFAKIRKFIKNELEDEKMMQSSINKESDNYKNHGDEYDCYSTHEFRIINFEIMIRIIDENELNLDVRYKNYHKDCEK